MMRMQQWMAGSGLVMGVAVTGLAQAAASFAPAANYPTGSSSGPGPSAQSMISVDLNNDGAPDVAAAEWQGDGVRSFLNDGSGRFGAAVATAMGTVTNSVAAGDFDGDGKADLVTTTSNEIVVMRGLGDGRFAEIERHGFSVGGQIVAYAFELNRDSRLDIVVPTATGVQVFLGQGNGHFTVGPASTVNGLNTALALANFNNDGIPDLALSDASGQQAILLRGIGDGSFTQLYATPIGAGPEDIIAGDLNGDGIDDVASADSFSFTMSVIQSNAQGGFGSATRYSGVQGPVSLRLADFDRDGRLDIAIPSVVSSLVQVYTNNGGGTFSYFPQNFSVSNQPQTPAIADYNRDGKPDIATAGTGTMSVLINTAP